VLVKSLLAYVLVVLVLLQTFSREVLVVDYALNQATITARFCVNKSRPMLHCNGKCHLAKQLKQQQEQETKAPNALKEKLEMLPLADSRHWVPLAPPYVWLPRCYQPAAVPALRSERVERLLQPPQV